MVAVIERILLAEEETRRNQEICSIDNNTTIKSPLSGIMVVRTIASYQLFKKKRQKSSPKRGFLLIVVFIGMFGLMYLFEDVTKYILYPEDSFNTNLPKTRNLRRLSSDYNTNDPLPPPPPPPPTTTTTTNNSLVQRNSHTGEEEDSNYVKVDFPYKILSSPTSTPSTPADNEKAEICFIKCAYGTSIEKMDMTDDAENDVTAFQLSNPSFIFYYFTNFENLVTPGWTKIIVDDMPFKRYITHSRYGKFLAWRVSEIQNGCKTVFYLDGQIRLNQSSSTTQTWNELAKQVKASPVGLLQRKHKYGINFEISLIIKLKKDLVANIMKLLEYFTEEEGLPEDDIDTIQLYQNTYFGYDPTNIQYQHLSMKFWSKYAKEDTSWRDQSLWAYMLYKHKIEPSIFAKDTDITKMFIDNLDLRGHGAHSYTEANDADAR